MTAKAETTSVAQPDVKDDVQTTAIEAGETQTQTGTTEVKKVNRRGVAGARGVQRLKFTHEIAHTSGLFLGQLAEVTTSEILIGEDKTGMPSFNGLEIPKITFTFTSNEEDPTKRHYATLTFNAVESNVETIPGGKSEWKVNLVLDYLNHILNVFVFKGRALTDAEASALSLSFEDFDDKGEYVPVEPEVVVAAWKVLFENVANMLNGVDGKQTFKTKDGKAIYLWIKLLRYVKNRKTGWQAISNGALVFPTFVGEGVIERFQQQARPSIRVDAVTEDIRPRNIETAKAPNGPGAGIPVMSNLPGGSPMGGMSGYADINSAAADDDIPF